MEGLVLQGITAGYNTKEILSNLNLSVAPGETLILMGMSGAGKTTLLRTILGLITLNKGAVSLHGQDISNVPLELRNIGYVPQNYGLFPHLSVFDNIAYGLRMRSIPRDEQTKRVENMLNKMELKGLEHQSVEELSGGQQQRVALARALVINPALLLLDEPLSNIDQATKLEGAIFLKELFATLHIPIIFVTHQYEDAQFLQGTVAILIDGVIEQIGSYQEILAAPKTPFIKKLLVPFFET